MLFDIQVPVLNSEYMLLLSVNTLPENNPASSNKENMPSTTFTIVDAFDIKGRGVVIVGDKTFSDFLEIKQCDFEVTTPTGEVLRCTAFKEWLRPSSTPHPDDTEAFFIRGRSKSEIPIGSVVKVTQV